MSRYSVSSYGVVALNNEASQVSDACEKIMSLVGQLEVSARNNPKGLGPHVSSLFNAIDKIKASVRTSEGPADEVSQKLRRLAANYEELLNNDPFQDIGTGYNQGGFGGPLLNKIAFVVGSVFYSRKNKDPEDIQKIYDGYVPLLLTNQTTSDTTYNDRAVTVFDHPKSGGENRICHQGSAYPDIHDQDCGLCSCGTIINKAGGNLNEKNMVDFSLNNGFCDFNGGTYPMDWKNILENGAGIDTNITNYTKLSELAGCVEEGKGVIIGVSACIYNPIIYGEFDKDKNDNHALVLESVMRDKDTDEIYGYYVIDSNGNSTENSCIFVKASVLEDAYYITGMQSVCTNDPIW